jgi:small subunit ribosomal protein S13
MIRIVGRNLEGNKKLPFALTPIKGIGKSNVKTLVKELWQKSTEQNLTQTTLEDFTNLKLQDLSDEIIVVLRNLIEENYTTEEDLRRVNKANIERLISINSWRGYRHKRGMPVRGQHTRKNSRTRRRHPVAYQM